jgi:hypothetical protein
LSSSRSRAASSKFEIGGGRAHSRSRDRLSTASRLCPIEIASSASPVADLDADVVALVDALRMSPIRA